jgi:hypothetical protein
MNAVAPTSEFGTADSSGAVLASNHVNHFGKEELLCI